MTPGNVCFINIDIAVEVNETNWRDSTFKYSERQRLKEDKSLVYKSAAFSLNGNNTGSRT